MALSYNEYIANGTDVMFVSKPYLKEEHLAVYVDGVLQTPTSYTVSGTSVTFNSAPVVNSVVRIGRLTNQNSRLVDYQDGSLLTEAVLDSDATQLFYMAQEAIDRANDGIIKNYTGNYDAGNKRISNVASPLADNDVVTKGFLSPNLDNINTVAGISSDVTTTAGISSEISAVVNNTAAINTVSNSISDVNKYADTYFISNTAPPYPTAGDLWFDTTPSVLTMKVYKGSSWEGLSSVVNGSANRYSYTATAGQTTFPAVYEVGYVDVYLNGVRLVNGASNDFTATDGTFIVLTTGATVGDTLDIVGYGTFTLETEQQNYLTNSVDSLLSLTNQTQSPAESLLSNTTDLGLLSNLTAFSVDLGPLTNNSFFSIERVPNTRCDLAFNTGTYDLDI